jgi:hypothetical protein
VPHAIAWRGHNPYQALPEHRVQSYPSLNEHTVGYGPFWGNGIPEHLHMKLRISLNSGDMQPKDVKVTIRGRGELLLDISFWQYRQA